LSALTTNATTLSTVATIAETLAAATKTVTAYTALTTPTALADLSTGSTMITALDTALQGWVNGASTGLSATVEQAIWSRGRARETLNASATSQEAVRSFAMRGFAKPPGMLAIELAQALQTAQDASSALSRDIAIKQADLEQTNRRFAMEMGAKLDGLMTARYGAIADGYIKRVQAYSAQAAAQASRMQAEADVYRAELQYNQALSGVKIDVAKANIANLIPKVSILSDISKHSAQVSAQMAASALSSVSLSSHVSAGVSASMGVSHGSSESFNYGWTASASSSDSVSTVTSSTV